MLRWIEQNPAVSFKVFQVSLLAGMNGKSQLELFIGLRREFHKRTQGVRLLSVENSVMFYGPIATPIPNRRKTMTVRPFVHWPMLHHDRLKCGDPLDTASWNPAFGIPQGFTHGDETVVGIQTHVDTLSRVPKLIERRVKVQKD